MNGGERLLRWGFLSGDPRDRPKCRRSAGDLVPGQGSRISPASLPFCFHTSNGKLCRYLGPCSLRPDCNPVQLPRPSRTNCSRPRCTSCSSAYPGHTLRPIPSDMPPRFANESTGGGRRKRSLDAPWERPRLETSFSLSKPRPRSNSEAHCWTRISL